jgi:peroxiredoxin Q/BCP
MKWAAILLVVLVGFLIWRSIALAADMPKIGEPAPAFSLPDQNGRARSLSDFGAKWLVLYFFPRADTPG